MKKRVSRGGSTESENSDECKMSPIKKDESVETEGKTLKLVCGSDTGTLLTSKKFVSHGQRARCFLPNYASSISGKLARS